MKTPSQEQKILLYLQSGNSITPLEALNYFGCLRLGARIHDLKQQGFQINTKMKPLAKGKYVAEYSILKQG